MIVIISDIHSNIEALEAVMSDIGKRDDIEETIVLGDVIGYGPNPRECLDLVMNIPNLKFSLLGNHEAAVIDEKEAACFNYRARMAIDWTRAQIFGDNPNRDNKYMQYLSGMILSKPNDANDMLFVHGSPRNPVREYVFPNDVHDKEKMTSIFSKINRFCFCGHTHVPGVFSAEDGTYKYYPIEYDFLPKVVLKKDEDNRLLDEKLLINVGSVGQPRDKNPDASYVIFNNDFVEFRRVPYDFEKTIFKIDKIKELDNALGLRLRSGK